MNSSNPTVNTAPAVASVATNTVSGAAVTMVLPATDPNPNPLKYRIVSQPAHGTVGVSNKLATYFPDQGFVGSDTFTFAANDTWSDSNLDTGTVAVAQGSYGVEVAAHAPPTYPARWPVAFAVIPMVRNLVAPVSFYWDFGDGTAHDTNQFPAHAYAAPGVYSWSVQGRAGGAVAATNGSHYHRHPGFAGDCPLGRCSNGFMAKYDRRHATGAKQHTRPHR